MLQGNHIQQYTYLALERYGGRKIVLLGVSPHMRVQKIISKPKTHWIQVDI